MEVIKKSDLDDFFDRSFWNCECEDIETGESIYSVHLTKEEIERLNQKSFTIPDGDKIGELLVEYRKLRNPIMKKRGKVSEKDAIIAYCYGKFIRDLEGLRNSYDNKVAT